jgi:hypothetical protein
LNANVHFHSLVLDGVFSPPTPGAAPVFHPLPAPTDEEIAQILEQIHDRVTRLLRRCGRLPEDPSPTDPVAEHRPWLAGYAAASIQEVIAAGPRAGQPVRRLRTAAAVVDGAKLRCARQEGFSLHANVALPAQARQQLEHLCRYLLRPPLALERLTESSGGQLLYELPHPRRDGATHLLLDPLELIEKLSVLIPRLGFTCSGSMASWPPRPPARGRGPALGPGGRAGQGIGARSFASGAPEPSLIQGRSTLLGRADEAGVRDRRSPLSALRRPPPHRGPLLPGAAAARSP